MQVNVSISLGPAESLASSASDIADAVLAAIGGDPLKDTVTVTTTGTAGLSYMNPGPVMPGIESTPPEPRVIGA